MTIKLYITLIFLFVLFPHPVFAVDVVKTFVPSSRTDPRSNYDIDLFEAVMKASEPEFGSYQILHIPREASQDRDLAEVISGTNVNVDIVATRQKWESQTIPIRIPLLKGMLGIRLFLIKKDKIDIFAQINQIDTLKSLAAGSGRTWTITQTLEKQGFKIVKGTSYDGLFGMLSKGRFDYFPRGLNEIYLEYEIRKTEYPDIIIEPTIVLQLSLPTYFFVSPKYPRLAKRLEFGLKKMQLDGSFDALFNKHFQTLYEKANLSKRKVFKVDTP